MGQMVQGVSEVVEHEEINVRPPPSFVPNIVSNEEGSVTSAPATDRVSLRRLAHLDEFQHSSPVPLTLFLMIFFIVGMVWLRFTRSSAESKKGCRKAKANDAKLRNSPELSC